MPVPTPVVVVVPGDVDVCAHVCAHVCVWFRANVYLRMSKIAQSRRIDHFFCLDTVLFNACPSPNPSWKANLKANLKVNQALGNSILGTSRCDCCQPRCACRAMVTGGTSLLEHEWWSLTRGVSGGSGRPCRSACTCVQTWYRLATSLSLFDGRVSTDRVTRELDCIRPVAREGSITKGLKLV